MPTCPNCGSIVMEGDPYCSHCGAHFKWNFIDDDEDYGNDSYASKPYYEESVSHDLPAECSKPEIFLDFGEVSETYLDADEDTLEYIASRICANSSQKLQLKAQIREYQKAKDFNGFHIRKDYKFEVYYFHFIQENEYVKTTHVMTYRQDSEYFPTPYQTFYDSYSQHVHDKLIANPRFQKLIEGVGLEFHGCSGGYETRFEDAVGDVTLTGEIEIRVYFNVDGKTRIYDLDLDEMKLIEDYIEFDQD